MAQRRKKKRSPVRWIFIPIFLAVAAGGAGALGALLAYINTLPPIEELENYEPPESTFVYDSQNRTALAEFREVRRYVLPHSQFPEKLILAFMAIEDKRFYDHFGVDPVGVVRAAISNFKAGRTRQGASTISMQLPGSIMKQIDRSEISYRRKIQEALIAFQIERRYSKEQILEFYLNQIYLGQGAYGVEAAAKTYFGKTVQELTLAECALLAGLPQAPSKINPMANPEASLARRNTVLRIMRECGYITKSELEDALADPLDLHRYKRQIDPYQAPYFVYYMRDALLKDDNFRRFASSRDGLAPETYLDTAGLRVISTLDMTLQRIAEEEVREGLKRVELLWHEGKRARRDQDSEQWTALQPGQERIGVIRSLGETEIEVEIDTVSYRGTIPRPASPPFYNPDVILREGELIDVLIQGVNRETRTFTGVMMPEGKIKGAMAVIEARTGRALAMVGGDNYYDPADPKAEYNYAAQGGRQPGSGIKPLFYAAAVSSGFTPNSVFMNVPFDVGGYVGRNYDRDYEGRKMTVQEGLERSQNVMMLRVFRALGLRRGVSFVRNFDYAWPTPSWEIPDGQMAVCLGTFDVSPLELAAAYIPFVNEGVAIRPYAVDSIQTKDGEIIFTPRPWRKVILSPQDAYVMNFMLRGVLGPRGTAYYSIGSRFDGLEGIPPMGGKTGTTTECRDAWFTGFTPDLIVSVAVGFDPPRSLGWKMTGGTISGPIFEAFIKRALETRDDWSMEFPEPPGIVHLDICLRTGLRAGKWCDYGDRSNSYQGEMVFKAGTEPSDVCDGIHD